MAEPDIDIVGARRDRLLYVLIGIASLVIFLGLGAINAFDLVYALTRDHESWQLDEVFSIFIVATFSLIAILMVHMGRLRREIVQRQRAEAAAEAASCYDRLTGVANRQLGETQLLRQIERARVEGTNVAVLMIDIDRFLSVNEICGHGGGDLFLQAVAERLHALAAPEDVVTRLGSDEFALLVPERLADADELLGFASRILSALRAPLSCGAKEVEATASIGISRYPGDAETAEGLLQCAEAALNEAKASGRDRYALYDRAFDIRRRQRLEVEQELKAALERGEIVAYYQPLVDLGSLRPAGFEALARWKHPERGVLGADDFIPIAEDAGLVGRILNCMLHRVCAETRDWDPSLIIAVNLSPLQLLDERVADQILGILAIHDFPPERLEIEVTETAVLADLDAARRAMSALKARGMRMSLDDFGTGYSGFRHLRELPFDKIKIDSSFTRRIRGDAQSRKIVSIMLALGEALELTTVAEGIEHVEEERWLRRQHCKLGQGYLFARPMPAALARDFAVPRRSCAG